MSIIELSSLIAALATLVGVPISMYALYLKLSEKRPRIIAKLNNGFLAYGPNLGDLMLMIEVVNSGEKSSTIVNFEFRWKKRILVFPNGLDGTTQIPFELAPGKNANFWIPMRQVKVQLYGFGERRKVIIRGRFKDAIGNEYLTE